MGENLIVGLLLSLIINTTFSITARAQDAHSIVEASFNYMRGNAPVKIESITIEELDRVFSKIK